MLCFGEYLWIYIAMFQKNNAAEKSATFHICNEAWQNLTLPKIEIPLPHIFTWPYILTFPTLIFESTVLCVVSVSETTKNSGILCTHGNLKGLVRFVSKCQVTKPECWRKYSSEWYEMKMVALPYCHREVLKKPWCYFPWFSVASLARRYSHKLFNPLAYQSNFHWSAQTPDFFNLGATCFISVGNQNKVIQSWALMVGVGDNIEKKLSKADKLAFLKLSANYRYRKWWEIYRKLIDIEKNDLSPTPIWWWYFMVWPICKFLWICKLYFTFSCNNLDLGKGSGILHKYATRG